MTATPLDLGHRRDRRRGSRSARWASSGRASFAFISHVLFPVGAAVGAGARRRRRAAPSAPPPQSTVLPLGLPDLPFHLRLDSLSAFFLLLLGAAGAGDLAVLGRLLPLERRHRARAALLPVPRVPRGDGAGAARRRRLRVHGGVGDDGAVVVLPGHHRPPHSRDPPRRLPLPADRARRRHRHPAVLRRAAGRQRRLHVRRDARDAR